MSAHTRTHQHTNTPLQCFKHCSASCWDCQSRYKGANCKSNQCPASLIYEFFLNYRLTKIRFIQHNLKRIFMIMFDVLLYIPLYRNDRSILTTCIHFHFYLTVWIRLLHRAAAAAPRCSLTVKSSPVISIIYRFLCKKTDAGMLDCSDIVVRRLNYALPEGRAWNQDSSTSYLLSRFLQLTQNPAAHELPRSATTRRKHVTSTRWCYWLRNPYRLVALLAWM